MEVDITTPSGRYKALEVTTNGNLNKTLNYYAPNIGLVKTVIIPNVSLVRTISIPVIGQIPSSLIKIQNNVSYTRLLE